MAINFSCPACGETRDNNAVRVVAGFVFIIAAAGLISALTGAVQTAVIILGLLAVDFIIRAFVKPKYSPLATLSRGIVSGLNLPKHTVDSAPKVFAARIGALFSAGAAILLVLGLTAAGSVVLVILLICAFLESVFSFCAGCWMYSLLPESLGNALAREFFSIG